MLNMRRSSATIFGQFLYQLKILATISSWFYAYWRSWRPILPDFMPTEDLGDQFLLILCLLKILAIQWQPICSCFIPISKNYLVTLKKKDHARVCQFGDWRNGVDMIWYDYMKRNKKINNIFLKEKENCRLKVRIINVGGEILIYKHTTGQNMVIPCQITQNF